MPDTPFAAELADIAGRNADIEAFALHSRVLLAFLYGRRGKPQDAVARDYFSDGRAWGMVRPRKPAVLAEVEVRVGPEVAHLSFKRSSPAEPWPYDDIWRAFVPTLTAFFEHALPDFISAETRGLTREILALAEPAPHLVVTPQTAGLDATIHTALPHGTATSGSTAVLPPSYEPPPRGD